MFLKKLFNLLLNISYKDFVILSTTCLNKFVSLYNFFSDIRYLIKSVNIYLGEKMAKSRYLEIYNFIKENINNGTYPPEEKIPSENRLKDIFSVSRNTVRKAIDLLASDGLLSSVHGKGVFVMKKIPVNFLLGGTESFKEASLKNSLKYKTSIPIFETLIINEELNKKNSFSYW